MTMLPVAAVGLSVVICSSAVIPTTPRTTAAKDLDTAANLRTSINQSPPWQPQRQARINSCDPMPTPFPTNTLSQPSPEPQNADGDASSLTDPPAAEPIATSEDVYFDGWSV